MRRLLSFLLFLFVFLCGLPVAALAETRPATAPASVTGKNWMSHIADETKLNLINIPGTHDSATDKKAFGDGKTQYHSVKDQLNFGVRFFDIRVGVCHNGSWNRKWQKWSKKPTKYWLEIFHGSDKAWYGYDTIMDWCRDFLRANPGETIIMSVKEDPDTPRHYEKNTQTLMMEAVEKYGDIFYTHTPGSQQIAYIPTLGEVRGKVVMVRRYSASGSEAIGINAKAGWPNDSYSYYDVPGTDFKIYVQDCYQFDFGCRDDKMRCWTNGVSSIKKHRKAGHNFLSFNLTSGYIKPYRVEYLADYMNHRIQSFYEREAIAPLGIVPMDCIRDKHARAIYLYNEFSQSVDILLSKDGQPLSGETTLQIVSGNNTVYKAKSTGNGKYHINLPDGTSGTFRAYLRGREIGTVAVSGKSVSVSFALFSVTYRIRGNEEGEVPKDERLYVMGESLQVVSEAKLKNNGPNTTYLLGFSADPNAGVPMRRLPISGKTELWAVWAVDARDPIDIGGSGVEGLWLSEQNGQGVYKTRDRENWQPVSSSGLLSSVITLGGTNDGFLIHVEAGSHTLALNGVSIRPTADIREPGILGVQRGASLALILAENSVNTLEVKNEIYAALNVAGSLTLSAPITSDGSVCGVLNARAENGDAGIAFIGGEQGSPGALAVESGRLNVSGTGGSSAIGVSAKTPESQAGVATFNGGTVNATAGPNAAYAIGADNTVSVVINGGAVNAAGSVCNPKNSAGSDVFWAQLTGMPPDTLQTLNGFTPDDYNARGVYSNGDGTLYFYIPNLPSQFYNESNAKAYYKDSTNVYREVALYVDTLARRIYANGNDTEVDAGAQSGKTLLRIDSAVQQLGYFNIPGDDVNGYDLSGYTLFGGAAFITGNANTHTRITMNGGVLEAVYGGGLLGVSGDVNVEIRGGTVGTVCAGGLGETNVAGNAQLAVSGGTVTEGVYAAQDEKQSFSNPVAVRVSGAPVLSGAEIGLLQAETDGQGQSGADMAVTFTGCGTGIAPLCLEGVDMRGGAASAGSLALSNAYVELAGVYPLEGLSSLTVPQNSGLTLSNSAAATPNVGTFNGGGSIALAGGVYIEAGNDVAATPSTTLLPDPVAEDTLLFSAGSGTDENAFGVSTAIGQYFQLLPLPAQRDASVSLFAVAKKEFVLMRRIVIDVPNQTLYLSGNDTLVKAGPAGTLLYYAAYPTAPIPLPGVPGDSTNGYDLSGYTVFGGGFGGNGGIDYQFAHITMEGGSIGTVYAGGQDATGSDGSVVMTGGSVGTLYAGGLNDELTGGAQVSVTGGSVGTLYVGGNGGRINGSAAAICSDGVINKVYVGDRARGGSIRGGARITLTNNGNGGVPDVPEIEGAYGTPREALFHNWYMGNLNDTECPDIKNMDVVRVINETDMSVSLGGRMRNVGVLELDESALWVKCGDLSVGALRWANYGATGASSNADREVGSILYENRAQSLEVDGPITGLFVISLAPDARVGDVVLRSPYASTDNFILDSDVFTLLKNGDTLILGRVGPGDSSRVVEHADAVYRLLSGGGRWKRGSNAPLSFTLNGNTGHLRQIEVDGSVVDAQYYDVSGDTVSLKAAYLNGLSLGAHKVCFVFTDGRLCADMELLGAALTPPATGGRPVAALFAACLAAFCCFAAQGKRRA